MHKISKFALMKEIHVFKIQQQLSMIEDSAWHGGGGAEVIINFVFAIHQLNDTSFSSVIEPQLLTDGMSNYISY